jgi:hypothetical protein
VLTLTALVIELRRGRRAEYMLFMWVLFVGALLNATGAIAATQAEPPDWARFLGAMLRIIIVLSFAGYVFWRVRDPAR